MVRCLVVVAAVGICSLTALADETAQRTAPPVDQYGDPLPVGAMARLGTTRLRIGNPTGVAFSPDGGRLAACGHNDFVCVWEAKSAEPLTPYRTKPAANVMAIRYSPDGRFLVGVGERGEVWAWEADTRELLWTANHHSGTTYGIAFSPDGTTLATAGGFDEPTVRISDLRDGRLLYTIEIDEQIGNGVPLDFSPDGTHLAFASQRTIQVWDMAHHKLVVEIDRPFGQQVTSLRFVDDGQSLLAAGSWYDRFKEPEGGQRGVFRPAIKLIDAMSGQLQRELPPPESADSEPIIETGEDRGTYVYFGRQGVYVCGMTDGNVRQQISLAENTWSRRSGSAALQPNGPLCAFLHNRRVHVVDLQTAKELHREFLGHASYVTSIAVSPMSDTIVTGDADGRVFEWQAESGQRIRELPGLEGWVRCLQFSPDGKDLLIAGEAFSDEGRFIGQARVCAYPSGVELWNNEVANRVMAAAISPDGERYALAEGLGLGDLLARQGGEAVNQVEIGPLADGSVTHTYDEHDQRATALAFCGRAGVLRLFTDDAKLHEFASTDPQPTEPIDLLAGVDRQRDRLHAIDRDGRLAVFSGAEYPEEQIRISELRELQRRGWIGLLDVETKSFRWIESIGSAYGQYSAISDDGRLVANYQKSPRLAGGVKSVIVRSADDGKTLLAFPIENFDIFRLAFTPDGAKLIGGTSRGDTIIWDLSVLAE